MIGVLQNVIGVVLASLGIMCLPILFVVFLWISFKLHKFYQKILENWLDKNHPDLYRPDRGK